MGILTVNSRKARSNLRDLLDQVFKGEVDVVIERNGKPVAVMIPVSDYEDLIDELDDLRAARRAAALYESWKRNPDSARPIEEVEEELKSEGLIHE
jgi:prevent-host-death family protein